jgi:cytochrome o ubiquinol oxidase subunit 2
MFALLSGCNMVLMHPAGDVAVQERDLLLASVALMLLIILPVMAMIILFAWRYRASNTSAIYEPEWHHSTGLEVAIWSAPLAIIVALGALTWITTHVLDPYRPLARIAPGRPVTAATRTLEVEAVALNWKWLFIYPTLGIATVNELAAPVDTPISFKITSQTMMNSFYVPALAGQIYAMPGMQTPLHAVINKVGVYTGFSSNYSGDGYSDMNFKFHGLSQADFYKWVQSVKAGGGALDRSTYAQLSIPSQANPVARYAATDPSLYSAILNECVDPSKMCVDQAMKIDAKGGGGVETNEPKVKHEGPHGYMGTMKMPNSVDVGPTPGLTTQQTAPAPR